MKPRWVPPTARCVLILSLLICLFLPAQGGAEGPVLEIRFETTAAFPPERFDSLTTLRTNHPFSWSELHADMGRLFATGLFEDVRLSVDLRPDGAVILYTLIEKRVIGKISWEGTLELPQKALRSALGLKEGEIFVQGDWRAGLNRLRRLYYDEGYPQAAVRGEAIFPESGGEARLIIRINAGPPLRIGEIRLEGTLVLDEAVVRKTMALSEGAVLSGSEVERGIRRLQAFYGEKGFWTARVGPATVLPVDESVSNLIVPIEAGPRVEIRFAGKKTFSEKRLRTVLQMGPRMPLHQASLTERATRLQRYFHEQGYRTAKVDVRKREVPEDNRIEILFALSPGPRFSLSAIRFDGNEHLDDARLLEVLEVKTAGWIRSGRFNEDILAGDVDRMITLYHRNGFLKVQIIHEIRLDPPKGEIVLLFHVEEGIRTRIREIGFVGRSTVAASVLLGQIRSAVGRPYDEVVAQEDRLAIEAVYTRLGYVGARVHLETQIGSEGKEIDLIFRIEEGLQSFVGKIRIAGNDLTREHVIRRELLIKPGDPLNPEKVLKSKQRLYRLGHFSEVQFEPLVFLPEDPTRDMEVRVRERPGGTVSLGGGYGDFERFRGFVEVGHRNLFGTGREIRGRVAGSRIEKRFSIGYREPWLFNRKETRGSVSLIYQEREEVAFTREKFGVTLSVDHDITEHLKGVVSYEIERDDLRDVPLQAQLSVDDVGTTTLATLNPSLIWDRRDDPFAPSSGFINGVGLRGGGAVLGSDVTLLKVNLQSSWFVAPVDRVVLAFSARGGMGWRFGDDEVIPIQERFFLGGQGTLRGYKQDQVGVAGETRIDGIPTGGQTMVLFNEEIRITLPWSLGWVLFFDHGNVWEQPATFRLRQVKTTVGTGLRIRTPVGPIRLDYGYKLQREAGEDGWRIHFTLGEAF